MGFTDVARQAWRMFLRDWRAGELHLLLVALLLAVGALSSVGFLSDRMQGGLERDARQMLAADLVVRSDAPLSPAFARQAQADGLATAVVANFPSMASVPNEHGQVGASRLSSLKAVSDGYPLRGRVRTAPDAGADTPDAPAAAIPAPGTVWVDAALLDALHVKPGESIRVGNRTLRIAAVITREMDRGFGFGSLAPRVMMRFDELPSTGLVQFGSRITYRLLVAGTDAQVARFAAWARPAAEQARGVHLESLEEGQPQVRQTLDRAERFLSLVALLAAVLAAVAVGIASRRYSERHLDACAVMRCLGLSRRALRGMVTLEFIGLGLIGGVLGIALGYAAHWVLLAQLGDVIPAGLPAPTWRPAVVGLASALVMLLGFALPPLLPLSEVAPLHVLRRDVVGGARRQGWRAYGASALAFGALLLFAARDLRLGAMVAGGFAAGAVVFGVLAWLAICGLAAWARRRGAMGGIGWRYAVAGLRRRGLGSALQVVALGLGLMALLLLAVTRNDLVAGWRQSSPPDAPNRFVIDIQPGQDAPVLAQLRAAGLPNVQLSPMIRARLTAINGKPVTGDSYTEVRARRLAEREFNLSYTAVLPDGNRVTAGQWYGDASTPQVSMEEGIAKTLGLALGDTLRFEVAGQHIDAPITSLRKLDWGSMRVNFFVVMPPAALRDFPMTWITSFHLAPKQQGVADALVRQFPNVTVIDTGALLAQIQQILSQVIDAVQALFVFTLAAGVLVLYAALAGTRDERMRESGILRALGASSRQLRDVHLAELVTVGALAGLLAALGAGALGWALARYVFEFALHFNPWLPALGVGAGVLCALIGGWSGLRAVLRQSALRTLREA
ncbi:ABC transporter permease [Pandoraea cepalis]|uniref:ABC transporter permease n=1 Tax=Pandoraea cepalis TaxID=2508294 RepID=A0A5E4WP39_9BURK|nr:FtsX-like permease family protein [Pandoraea cepalis]VVE26727.1 ABC transporter permease [Pandoraea cepalis]